jgi:RNA 2',3'-cyclic 3'-phosphodiesterase
MRLFFAVELGTWVQAELAKLRPANSTDYRWPDPSLLHVTLAFLGEQPEECLEVLRTVGAAAAHASSPGHLRLGEPGSFGSKKAPRVLWVGLAGDIVSLNGLQSHLTKGLLAAGFIIEDRAFAPHITLARRRDTARSGPPDNWPPPTLKKVQFEMDHLTLFQSRLSPKGPSYIPLFTFPLH